MCRQTHLTGWLGRQDSNLRSSASKAAAVPLGHAPICVLIAARRNIVTDAAIRNGGFDVFMRLMRLADTMGREYNAIGFRLFQTNSGIGV